jgi:hypothetical protein
MKSIFLSVLALGISMAAMSAEEMKRPVMVEEMFFGSNSTGYALLRTETETTANDGFLRQRTWMDEYAKEAVPLDDHGLRYDEEKRVRYGNIQTKLTQSTLLLDVTIPKNSEADTKPGDHTAAVNVASQGAQVALAAMLLRYPKRVLTRWSPDQMKQLEQTGFFYSFKTQTLVNGRLVRARTFDLGGDAEMHQALGPTSVSSVEEDENCLYLTFHANNPEHMQTRIFCMLPAVTANVRHLAACEPFVLLAGRFDTKNEALESAQALRSKLNAQKDFADVELQVWNVSNTNYDRAFYFVVMPQTSELIQKGRVAGLQEFIGTRLPLVPSKTFSVMIEQLRK